MKPSNFQRTIQCQFDCKLKRVVKGIVRNYRKELKRRRNKEISYCELPEIVVEKLAVWDEYESDYTAFDVCGIEVRVLDDDLAEAIKYLSEKDRELNKADRYVCEIASHGDCTPRPFQKESERPTQ